jgi:hypothetical protein
VTRTAVLVLATIAVACHRDPPPPGGATTVTTTTVTTSNAPVGAYDKQSDGTQVVSIEGIRIEAAADLPFRAGTTTTVSGNNTLVVTLKGWSISVHEGKLTVAGTEFGAAPTGSIVRLTADGVHVDGERRGPLP